MRGFLRTNLLYMRGFAEAWAEEPIVQQVAGQLKLTLTQKTAIMEFSGTFISGGHHAGHTPDTFDE